MTRLRLIFALALPLGMVCVAVSFFTLVAVGKADGNASLVYAVTFVVITLANLIRDVREHLRGG